MQYYSKYGLDKIESYVSTLPGVRRCLIDTEDAGALEAIRVMLKPGRSSIQMSKEISTFLKEVLDVTLPADRILIEEADSGETSDAAQGFYRRAAQAPSHEEEAEEPRRSIVEDAGQANGRDPSTEPRSAGENGRSGPEPEGREPPRQETGADDSGDDRELDVLGPGRRQERVAARDGDDRMQDAEQRPGASSEEPDSRLELLEYGIFGGRGGDVELRVRLSTTSGVHEEVARAPTVEALEPPLFVDTALRAAEKAVDQLPVHARAERILFLEAEDIEEVGLRTGRFVAVTIRARTRGGGQTATGLRSVSGAGAEDALHAALDAVNKLMNARRATARESESGEPSVSGEAYDPFTAWD